MFATLVGHAKRFEAQYMKPVFRRFRLIYYAYESLRCLDLPPDLAIFVLTDRQTDGQNRLLTMPVLDGSSFDEF
jgi:hypothetical protein